MTHGRMIVREPAILFWAFAFPLGLAAVLGLAFGPGEEPPRPVGVVDDAQTAGGWTAAVTELTAFRLTIAAPEQLERDLRAGRIDLIVSGPRQQPEQLQYRFDPANSEARTTWLLLTRAVGPDSARSGTVEPVVTPGSRYIDFLLPGLLALGVMNSCLWGIGWGLIEMRQKRQMRRLILTPMPRTWLLGSLFAARLGLMATEWAVLLIAGALAFGLGVHGSWAAFLAVFLAGNLAFFGIGVLAGSRTESVQVGNGILNAVSLPMILLSGIFFSYERFPSWATDWIAALPLTLIADALRAVMLEGAGLVDIAGKLAALIVTGGLALLLGLRIFRWH
jgi:ABC-type multidrug transport system permease subunit